MESDRRRNRKPLYLSSSPLVHVLAQVRIGPVLKMQDHVPDLQDHYRSAGYPRFGQEHTRMLQFAPGREPGIEETTRWIFKKVDGSTAIVVSRDFVVVETRSYETFDKFTEVLQTALEILTKTVGATVVERLGLRYVDLIDDSDGRSLDFYLQPGLLGISSDALNLERRLHRVEVVGSTTRNSNLVIRVSQNDEGQFLPPDLTQTSIEYDIDSRNWGVITLLDIDHFHVRAEDLEIERVIDRFWDLHNETDLAFRAAVTPEAMQQWGLQGGEAE